MGLFSNMNSGSAVDAAQDGYNEAADALSPYTQYAGQDFDNARDAIYQGFDYLYQRPHYSQNFSQILGMSPSDLLNQAMSGYSMNVGTQNKMKVGESAANNSAAAAGMSGSGDSQMLDAEIGSMIYGQGMDQYLSQLLGAFGTQSQALQGYQQPIGDLTSMFSNMLGTEYGASSQLASDAMRSSQVESNAYNRQAANNRSNTPVKGMIGALGASAMF